MLSTMARVQVIGTRHVLDQVVRRLHDLGMVQIEDAASRLDSTETILHKGIPDSPEASRLEALLGRIGGVLAALPSTEGRTPAARRGLALDPRDPVQPGTQTVGDGLVPSLRWLASVGLDGDTTSPMVCVLD